jgi:Clp amino terminal domain, pathogenicity island component
MFERYSNRARCLIVMALWSARRRGGLYVEPEDLLHALIREDRGELPAVSSEVFPGPPGPLADAGGGGQPFFSGEVARNLLRELHQDPDPLLAEPRTGKLEPAPHTDLPVSRALKDVLALVAKAHRTDTKTIEPLDLLSTIVANRESRLAQLLRDHGITRQKVYQALHAAFELH